MYINSPGGSFTALTAIYDTMQYIRPDDPDRRASARRPRPPRCCSRAGTPGKRLALPNARVLIHQPAIEGGGYAQASDLEIQANEIIRMRELARGRPSPSTRAATSSRSARTSSATRSSRPRQAKEYGLVDEVLAEPQEHRLTVPDAAARRTPSARVSRRASRSRPVAAAARGAAAADSGTTVTRATGGGCHIGRHAPAPTVASGTVREHEEGDVTWHASGTVRIC